LSGLREFKLCINDIRAAIDKISEYVEGKSLLIQK
jgi:hypothetical protein